jgi:hypothetical protein
VAHTSNLSTGKLRKELLEFMGIRGYIVRPCQERKKRKERERRERGKKGKERK